MYNTHYMLLNFVCWLLIEDFCIYIHKKYCTVVSFSFYMSSFWYQSITDLKVWTGKFSLVLHFLRSICKGSMLILFKTFGRIQQWGNLFLNFPLWKVLKLLLKIFPFYRTIQTLFFFFSPFLCLSRYVSISSKLSSWLVYTYL